jgi:hypothetical protein
MARIDPSSGAVAIGPNASDLTRRAAALLIGVAAAVSATAAGASLLSELANSFAARHDCVVVYSTELIESEASAKASRPPSTATPELHRTAR